MSLVTLLTLLTLVTLLTFIINRNLSAPPKLIEGAPLRRRGRAVAFGGTSSGFCPAVIRIECKKGLDAGALRPRGQSIGEEVRKFFRILT